MASSIGEEDADQQTQQAADSDHKAHQACYIFKPSHNEADDIDERPKKRRKFPKPQNRDDAPLFPYLLGGKETIDAVDRRQQTFNQVWAYQQEKIDKVVNHVDEEATQEIVRFVEDSKKAQYGRLPTGLVVGLAGGIQSRLLKQWRDGQSASAKRIIQLDSTQAPNLQTALKNIIKATVSQVEGAEGYQDLLSKHKRLIPMNFDLELLQLFAEDRRLEKIVISILDVETFDMSTLSDLISSLSSWSDRIQFVLLLGLTTTIELFEARLPKSVVRLLNARVFDFSTNRDINYEIFRTAQADPGAKLWLGPTACGVLVEMTKDQDTTPEGFSRAVKYAYMSHFFANPLSVLLSEADLRPENEGADLCEAIRNTASFRRYAEKQLPGGKAAAHKVRNLLNDDDYLLSEARSAISEGQKKMCMTFEAIDVFKELPVLLMLQPPANASAFDIEMEALSGADFINSDPYISIMLVLEKLRSNHLLGILSHFSLTSHDQAYKTSGGREMPLGDIQQKLHVFQAENGNLSIRNAYDPSHPSHATTVTQQGRVAITKKAAKLTPLEEAYTEIMDTLLARLESYFETHITKSHYTNLFMHEAFVYDLKNPLSGIFAPQPRFAIERALGRPGDYLGCECCADGDGAAGNETKHEKLPPTSVLWKLWCEAGAIVNVRDLWEAFRGILVGREDRIGESDTDDDQNGEGPDPEAEEQEGASSEVSDRRALALFYRSLAELEMLGFVKASKKKPGVDCLAKTSWAGL